MGTIAEDNFLVWNQGKNPLVNFNFMLRVELLFDLPCKSVRAFTREMEYDYIQEGGLNDYVHMRRKPITKPFTLEVERYVGVDYVDPMPLGGDLTLPVLLFVGRAPNQFIPGVVARTYVFTGCTVMKKVYGELVGDKSGLLVETTTLGYREMLVVNIPWSAVATDIGAEYATPATNSLQSESRLNDLKARSQRAAEQAEADAAAAKRMISEAEGLLSRMSETADDENEEDLIGALNTIYLKIEGGQAADSEAEPDQLPLVQSNNSAVQSTSDLTTAETHFQKVMSASQGIAACKQEIQSKVERLRSEFNATLEQEQTAQADPSEREARRQRAVQAAEQAAREAAEREALRAREREAEEQREQERQAAREAAQREREAKAQEEAQERRQAEEAAEAALAAELVENAAAREEHQAKARATEEAREDAQGAGSADGTGAADGADDAGGAEDAENGPDGQDTRA